MQFQHGDSRISGIQPAAHDTSCDSIINQLNLLDTGFESKVVKIESFIYAQEYLPHHTPRKVQESFLHDCNGDPIPAISPREVSPYVSLASQRVVRDEPALRKGKKSIKEEIIQENQLLERRLNMNKPYMSTFPQRQQPTPACPTDQQRVEEQYGRSKVVKLYNFILREVPSCPHCDGFRAHFGKQGNGCALKCKDCEGGIHPLPAVLFDLENKGRFEEEVAAYQSTIDTITAQISSLQQQMRALESLREKVTNLKSLSRRKYKEINDSKFYLRKHIADLQQGHLSELQKLLPKEYLQQLDLWTDIQQQHKQQLQGCASALLRVVPTYLHPCPPAKLLGLQRLLSGEKEQAVKLSVSEGLRFPLKRMETAVLVVDGSYSLPVFQDVHYLQLQFQNKKTLRELQLLFGSFPRQVYSLSFTYNHKLHSHISAEAFPFLSLAAALPSLRKLRVSIENVKDFKDITDMATAMTPKVELQVTISKHVFSKSALILPQHYYRTLFTRLGSQITRLHLDLPESADSPAIVDYQQLLSLPCLVSFCLRRGDKQSTNVLKKRILQAESIQAEERKQFVVKKALAMKSSWVRTIKKLDNPNNKPALHAVLMFLL